MVWTKQRILQRLARLHRSGADLSYNALARNRQALLSAAAYHFGSYRSAIERAGIDYHAHCRRPRWTKKRIIALIKQARRARQELNWSAVTRRGDELSRAAFASLQPRLFGKWARALHAAGLDADEISRYHNWDRNTVVFQLRARYREQEPLNSGAVQHDDPALHAASVRLFEDFDQALRAAQLNPSELRQRQKWSRASILRAMKQLRRRGAYLSDTSVRRQHPALHGAACRLLGSFTAAREAAGISFRAVKRNS